VTDYTLPEALRQDSDGDEWTMPEALAEYHVRRTVGAD
jgi:hypothetical protein